MSQSSLEQLSAFFQRCEAHWAERNQWPEVEYDQQWPSPCQRGAPIDGMITWQPAVNSDTVNFDNVAKALDCQLHPSINDFFSSWYSDPLACRFINQQGDAMALTLVQAWNLEDYQRLQENVIAHVLMQRRLKLPDTVFIASCEDEMQIVSVVNDSGEVILEQLGKGAVATLAPSLAEFLDQLQPV
ncbi:SecY-interacting protein [Motilimonas eburnea]|uniref:SecY-interacting protein n=1 Tax=Motilimonas eburnea TaxID=1737488 RepID=UPI001E2EFD9B|nr:SecY-interacting protein [Motilimonas eburnea]